MRTALLALLLSVADAAPHAPPHAPAPAARRNSSCASERVSFVILGWQHSGAEWLCRVLSRHPEMSCAKQSAGEYLSKNGGLSAKVADVPSRMLANCSARVCGYRVLPAERLGASALGAVLPRCAVKLIVERSNRNLTSELAASSRYTTSGTTPSPHALARYAKLYRDWGHATARVSPKAASAHIITENMWARRGPVTMENVLEKVYKLLDVHADDQASHHALGRSIPRGMRSCACVLRSCAYSRNAPRDDRRWRADTRRASPAVAHRLAMPSRLFASSRL